MTYLEQIADGLAVEVLKLMEATGDEDIADEVKKIIGASSTTLEEAYMTAVRVRRAEARARTLIAQVAKKAAE